jgi:secernin
MCDTMLAPPSHTVGCAMLFAKNSDRQRNEAQTVEYFPGGDHAVGTQVHCTYLSIPQVHRTHGVVLCRPFWAWGAEMGANEHGVVIGNEAVHARSPASERNELPGMDLVRLGLERAHTAAEALDVITSLLVQHGGGGNCGHLTPAYYNNGFIVADAIEAYVLETVEREWLVERIGAPRSISNAYSIGRENERCSRGLSTLLQERGWSRDPAPHYAEVMANPNREHIGYAGARRARSSLLLRAADAPLSAEDMMAILRDHGPATQVDQHWHPDRAATLTLCMHAGAAGRIAQTAGSMISQVYRGDAVHWFTGTAAPCTSIFKPVFLDAPPPQEQLPTERFDPGASWWRHERLHRSAILGDFARFLAEIGAERDALEATFRARVDGVMRGGNREERARVVSQCWQEARALQDMWLGRVATTSMSRDPAYVAAWDELNRLAGIAI